jgi:hypothetical protein
LWLVTGNIFLAHSWAEAEEPELATTTTAAHASPRPTPKKGEETKQGETMRAPDDGVATGRKHTARRADRKRTNAMG